jgi:hypothetical protein
VRRNTLLPSYSYETICNLSLRVRAPDFSECIPNAHYESRAWTFQESLLSKRCLLFTNTETYFHCSYGLRRMDDSQVRNNDLLFNTHYTLPDCLLSTPDTRKGKEHWSHAFPGYGQLVREYTHRHLSYSLDALNAFSGFLELFKHRFGGEMISGLPSKFFDAALLWVWVDEQQQHERNFHFPSWSWAGWIGPAQYWAVPDSLLPPFSKNILDRWYFMFEPLRLSRQLKCAIARFYFSRQTPRQEINRDILYIEHSDINAGDILESQTYPSEEPISRDILEFDALAVNIARIRGYKLRNNNQSVTEGVCGAVLSADRNLEDYDQHSTDLVLLSQFSPLSLDQEISKILERIYFDANVLPIRKWCLLNVMIIGWNPGRDCAERLGLCVLHEDIWNRLDSQMKRITLA